LKAAPSKVKAELQGRLHAYAGKPIGVVVRSAPEMLAILKANPFPKAETKYTYVIFLQEPPRPLTRSLMFLDSRMSKCALVKERSSFTTVGEWAVQNCEFQQPRRAPDGI
jgi:hypothetical protein